jgi:hypothetical protein
LMLRLLPWLPIYSSSRVERRASGVARFRSNSSV